MKQETLRRCISFGLLTLLVLIFSLTSDVFLTPSNIFNILREASIVGTLAIGITMVIITGGNDLSCGALLGLAAMLLSRLLYVNNMNIWLAMLITLGVCLLGGLFNGFIVAILRIPDFIATLSSKFVFSSLTLIFAIRSVNGMITTKTLNDPLIKWLGGSTSGGLYYATVITLILAVAGQFILKKTKKGVYIYAIGSNRSSAELSGISYVKTKFFCFLISAFCAFAGALLFLGKIRSVEPESGLGLEFKAISATVIGGCAFSGGRGDIVGSVIGIMFMKVLENGLLKFNFSSEMQRVLSGAVIVIMLIFDAIYNQYMQSKVSRAAAVAQKGEGKGWVAS